MKIMGRALLGLAITVIFTAGILFAINSIDDIDSIDSTKKDSTKKPFTSASDYHSTYQTQKVTESQRQSAGSSKSDDHFNTEMDNRVSHESNWQQAEQADEGHQNGQQAASKKNAKELDQKENSFETVSQEYFSDAVFIGDSRTVGMQQSGLIPNAVYYAKVGIGIGEILSTRFVWEDGMSLTVPEALSRHSFDKVYIMVGINDMSAGDTDWFVEQYTEILQVVQETQPNAVIYIQGNIPMSYGTQDMSGSLNNPNLAERNQASRQLADNKNIFYLDIASVYADGNGHLLSQYTSDGLHVLKKYYSLWEDYLFQHAIVREDTYE